MAIVAITVKQKKRENSKYTAQLQMCSKTSTGAKKTSTIEQYVSYRLVV